MVPAPASLLGRLGSWSYRHRRLVAAGWLVALVLVMLAGRSAGAEFKDNLNAGSGTHLPVQRPAPAVAGTRNAVGGSGASWRARRRLARLICWLARLARGTGPARARGSGVHAAGHARRDRRYPPFPGPALIDASWVTGAPGEVAASRRLPPLTGSSGALPRWRRPTPRRPDLFRGRS
jgi:hypothetical protein